MSLAAGATFHPASLPGWDDPERIGYLFECVGLGLVVCVAREARPTHRP